MNLKEMVNTMMPSDRLIVKDTYGEELYRGYAANYDNTQQQALRAVQCTRYPSILLSGCQNRS